MQNIYGWEIQHKERVIYHTSSGSPKIQIKFYHYPKYRQQVHIDSPPAMCKNRKKGFNSYFWFDQKVRKKGSIVIDRVIRVFPQTTTSSLKDDWGRISDFDKKLTRKYKQASAFWPLQSENVQKISDQDWFDVDNLTEWIQFAYQFINSQISVREKQDERLGVYRTLKNGIGDCDEFTDLLITLTRVRGIPSRRITGYFVTKKGEAEAHAWCEILAKKGWITIDLALNNLGKHTSNYIVLKVEEFNPELPDYQIRTSHYSKVHYRWERKKPQFIAIYQ